MGCLRFICVDDPETIETLKVNFQLFRKFQIFKQQINHI
jgi:hypothetical protein